MRLAPAEPVQLYVTNIKHCMYELLDWNRDVVGSICQRINLCQDKLKIVSDMTIRKSIFLGNLSFVRSVNSHRRKKFISGKGLVGTFSDLVIVILYGCTPKRI